ncbi:3249_t:CDS:2 [Funneliformis caledonium]|uniref:3249_t:CDS:1 n=1 Tax=Funneliformis caledonium TaxID=1117310 RepID=A0A9N9GSX4_9GLOM|nr:3249_t:CDS:2 [Funneliformis caledonium]
MVQQGKGSSIESKVQNVTPTLPHLVDLSAKCTLIKQLTSEILQKAEKNQNFSSDPSTDGIKSQLASSFIQLRSLNRKSNLEKNSGKFATQEAKLAMDKIHLQLQDLNYMKNYLQREIRKCRSFRSIYQKVPLLSEEEFLKNASDELTAQLPKGATKRQQQHHRMLQRLNHEKEERLRLQEVLHNKLKRKMELGDSNLAKKSKIEQVHKEFETFLKEAIPLKKLLVTEEAEIKMETE